MNYRPEDRAILSSEKEKLNLTFPLTTCSHCPLQGTNKAYRSGIWGQGIRNQPIKYLILRNRSNGTVYIFNGKQESVIQEYIKEAKLWNYLCAGICFCRPESGKFDRTVVEAMECCRVNFDTLIKSILQNNKLLGYKEPLKILLLGVSSFDHMFPGVRKKSEALSNYRNQTIINESMPGVEFRISYDPSSYQNQSNLMDLRRDILALPTDLEAVQKVKHDYYLIETIDQFDTAMEILNSAEKFSFDIETSGLRYTTMKKIIEKKRKNQKIRYEEWEKDFLIGISFSTKEKSGMYIPLYIKLKHFDEAREKYIKEISKGENPLHITDESTLDSFGFWFGDEYTDHVMGKLKEVLENPSIKKIAHNGKFDCKFLEAWAGIEVKNFWWDTMLGSYILNENTRNGLDWLAGEYPDLGDYKDLVKDRLSNSQFEDEAYSDVPIDILYIYACKDADLTFRLQESQQIEFDQEHEEKKKSKLKNEWVNSEWLFHNFYMPLSNTYKDAEMHGILFDKDFAESTAKYYKQVMEEMQERIDSILKASGIKPLDQYYQQEGDRYVNLNSPKQKKQLFFTELGWPRKKPTKTAKEEKRYKKDDVIHVDDASTDQDVLKQLLEEFYELGEKNPKNKELYDGHITLIEAILEYLKKSKMINTYLEGKKIYNRMDVNGFIHFIMKLHGTVSGRLSSTPNVQNLPRKTFEIITPTGRVIEPSNIRGIFTAPPPFKVFSADLSQAELRIMADYAEDERMLYYIKNNIDIHWRGTQLVFYDGKEVIYNKTDSEMKRLRKLIKLCNFGGLYGGSDQKKVTSVNEKLELGEQKINLKIASKHSDWFFIQEFKRIRQYIEEMEKHILENGWIDNKFGRRRRLPEAKSENRKVVAEAQRQGINAQIQGTASDIVQLAYIKTCNWIKEKNLKSRALWTVHDEIDGYVHPDEEELLREMIPKFMTEKTFPVDRIEVPLESEFEVFNNRWGD